MLALPHVKRETMPGSYFITKSGLIQTDGPCVYSRCGAECTIRQSTNSGFQNIYFIQIYWFSRRKTTTKIGQKDGVPPNYECGGYLIYLY